MPLFVMIGWDGPDGARQRDQHRERHLTHIHTLRDQGRIQYAGPIKSEDGRASIGAVIVYEANALDQAREMVDGDPYVAGGVFETVTVHPFKQVIPEPQ